MSRDRRRDQRPPPLWLLVTLPALAFTVTPLLILVGAKDSDASKSFAATPQFYLWLLIVSASSAVWVLGLVFTGVTAKNSLRALEARQIIRLGIAAVMLMSCPVALIVWLSGWDGPSVATLGGLTAPNDFPLTHHALKVSVLVGVAVVLGGFAIVAMWATAVAIGGIHPRPAGRPKPTADDVNTFLALRAEIVALLGVAGVLIGLGTLSAGALRVAALAAPLQAHQPALKFAQEYVVGYGLFFSCLLALAFVPAFVAIQVTGARLRECAHPLPAPASDMFDAVVESRSKLDALLQTNLSATATFKAGVAILTPLAASLIALVLPGS
jgi:hypothetical protein